MRHLATATLLFATALAACVDDGPTIPAAPEPSFAADVSDPTPGAISLEKIGEFAGGAVGAAEITAYDFVSRRLFVVNGTLGTVDVLDLRNPARPTPLGTLDVSAFGAAANSVAADEGVVAVAVQAHEKTDPGTVAFYRATTLQPISSVTVGALPDMLAFSESGRLVVVANEGEPNDAYTIDPEGSVSIIDAHNLNRPTVRTARFTSFNGQADALRAAGVRIYGPGASAAQDFGPEYVTISSDERTAYVTLQENNALATLDIPSATVTSVVPFGYKNHALPGNELDASDRDGIVNIRSWPVFGMFQPDAIASYKAGGQTFLVTANEGDARDYDGFAEEARVNSLSLNPALFTDAVCGGSCANNARLGRLTVTTSLGFNPATGQFDALYALGGRSFSIWSASGETGVGLGVRPRAAHRFPSHGPVQHQQRQRELRRQE